MRSARAPRLLRVVVLESVELLLPIEDEEPLVLGEADVLLSVLEEPVPEAPMLLELGVLLDDELLGVLLLDDEELLGVLEVDGPAPMVLDDDGLLEDDGVLVELEELGVLDVLELALSPPAFGAVELVLPVVPLALVPPVLPVPEVWAAA